EGRFGFLHAYSGEPYTNRLLEGRGKPYQLMRTAIKPYACCRYIHGPVDCVLEIVTKNNLRPEQIAKIRCAVQSGGAGLVADPIEQKRNPQNLVDAQFSACYGAA